MAGAQRMDLALRLLACPVCRARMDNSKACAACHRAFPERDGLPVLINFDAGLVLGPGKALLWSISYFVKAASNSDRLATLIAAAFFWVRLLERRARRGPALDAASGLYFLGSKAAQPMRPSRLPDYYASKR